MVNPNFFYLLLKTLEELNVYKAVVRAFFSLINSDFTSEHTLTLTQKEISTMAKISDSGTIYCLMRLQEKKILGVVSDSVSGYRLYKLTPEFRGKIDELLGINTKA